MTFFGLAVDLHGNTANETKPHLKESKREKIHPQQINRNRRNYHNFCLTTVMGCSVFHENIFMAVQLLHTNYVFQHARDQTRKSELPFLGKTLQATFWTGLLYVFKTNKANPTTPQIKPTTIFP